MTTKNLINHLNYFNCTYKQLSPTIIIYTPNTSPQYELLAAISEFNNTSVFDYNKQTKRQLKYNPTIKQSLEYIEQRAPNCNPLTNK